MLHMNNHPENRRIWNQLKNIESHPSIYMTYYLCGMLAGSMLEACIKSEERERVCMLADRIVAIKRVRHENA